MDIVTGLVCVTITLISAVIIYVISKFPMQEKTFDEAMADRKKFTEKFQTQTRTAKDKSKDKKEKKKAGKKVKEKQGSLGTELENFDGDSSIGKHHVGFVEPAAVLDENPPREEILVNILPPNTNVVKSEIVEPKSNIHGNKINTAANKLASGEQKQNSKQTKPNKPKQAKQQSDVEKHSRISDGVVNKPVPAENIGDSIDVKPLSFVKQDLIKENIQENVVNDKAFPLSSGVTQQTNGKLNASPTAKSGKKKKNEFKAFSQIGDGAVDISVLMSAINKLQLSKNDVQVLIDYLLNKQLDLTDGSSVWIEGRQDPVIKLKKQLAEKEKALADELESSIGLQNRLKELRSELNAEKHTVRTLEEAIEAKHAEVTSFSIKLKQVTDEKQAIAQQIQQLQGKLNDEQLIIHQLQQEGAQAQNVLQQEYLAQRQQLEMHIAHLNETQIQKQERIATLEAQLTNQIQEHDALTAEFTMLQERTSHLQDSAVQANELLRQIEELKSVRANLEHHVTAAKYETGSLQTKVTELSNQLNIARTENEKLNNAVQSLQNDNVCVREANERLNNQISSANVEARQLRNEYESLSAQMTASMERPATEGRENGDTNYAENDKTSHFLEQEKKHIKESMLEDLNAQLKTKELQIENLTSEVFNYKTEVGEQHRLIEKLKIEVLEHQKEAERLANELAQQISQVSRLTEQLDSKEQKNNELRAKNYKVMEALSSTELLLKNKIEQSEKLVNDASKTVADTVILEQQSSTRQLLQRVFPELIVPECKGQKEWFSLVEKALSNWKPQQPDINQNSNFTELEQQNNQLHTLVTHYKKIITDTEVMLNTLQSYVEQEEGKWGEELQNLKSQLEAVTRERDALQANCNDSIQKASTNGFNYVDDGCEND